MNNPLNTIGIDIKQIGTNPQLAGEILRLRDDIIDWSDLNEYGSTMRISGVVY